MDEHGRSGADRRANEAPLRIVYIVGTGRSGSTLLDTILGNHPEIESVGELCHACESGWPPGRLCACGRPSSDCPFWCDVRRRWTRLSGTRNEQSYVALLRGLEKRRIWLPRLVSETERPSARFREYAQRTKALYAAILAASGKSVLVDTSKRSARAFLLSRISGVDLRVIHLVRDGRAAVWSMRKRNARLRLQREAANRPAQRRTWEPWRTAAFWTIGNLQAEWVRRQLPADRSIRVRYEDYTGDLEHALAEIGRFVGLDMSALAPRVVSGQPMQTGHTSGGSRFLTASSIRVHDADVEWTEKTSPWDRIVSWAIMGRLLNRYGYERSPESHSPGWRKAA